MSKEPKAATSNNSQQLLEQLVANIDGIVWELDPTNFHFTYVSPQAERILGFPIEQWFVPGFWSDHLHPEDRDWAVAYCQRATREKRNHDFEYRMVSADGGIVWLRDLVSLVMDSDEVVKLRGIMVDVTEHKRADEKLRESEKRLRLVLDAAKLGEWEWNILSGEVVWSPQVLGIYGIPQQEKVSYERFLQALHPDDRGRIDAALNRAVENRSSYDEEKRVVWPDGSIHWTASRAQVYCDAAGQPERMIGITFDITDQKLSDEKLRASEERLRLAAHASDIGFWDWDLRTDQVVFSAEWKGQLGYQDHEIRNEYREWERRLHPDDLPATLEALDAYLEGRKPEYAVELRLRHKDGTYRWIYVRGEVFRDAESKPIRMLGCHVDITDRKRAEEDHQAHLVFLESMDKVNRAVHGTNDIEQMMSDVLDAILDIFQCDRAWLVCPCDPEAATWKVPMERTRPEYPGAFSFHHEVPMDAGAAEVMRAVRNANGPVQFGPHSPHVVPPNVAKDYGVQSFIAIAVYPKSEFVWMFGLHQCSYPRVWTVAETRLLQEISRRLADALTSLLAYRAIIESEKRLDEAQRIAHLGYWTRDIDSDRITWSDETYRIHGMIPQECPIDRSILFEFIHPDDRQAVREAVAEAIRGGPRYEMEFRVVRKSGDIRVVHSQGDVVCDGVGKPVRLFGTVQDITERKRTQETLLKTERQLRTLVENFPDFIARFDRQCRHLFINPAVETAFGVPLDQVVGRTPGELDHFGSATQNESLHASIRLVFETGQPDMLETLWTTKQGDRFFEVRHIPELDDNGHVVSVLGIARDVTERRFVENELRASESRFRTLVDHATDAFFLHGERGIILDVNRQACESLGYSRDELIGMYPVEFDPGATKQFLEELENSLDAGDITTFESRYRRKDGTTYPVEVRMRPFGQDGRLFNVSLARDITKRKQTEQALLESHRLLNAVVEGTSDAVYIKDLEGRYLMINSAGAHFLGKKVEEVIGCDDNQLFTHDTAQILIQSDQQAIKKGGRQTFEEVATAAGVTRTYLSSKDAYLDSQGNLIGLIGVSRDITELKRLEEQFRQSQKMEAVGRLAGGIAHDFNNLLTAINGYSELIFTGMHSDDPNRELLLEVIKAGERSANLVRQLLAFSRKQVLQPRAVSLNSVIDNIRNLLRRIIREDVDLHFLPDRTLGLATVDPGQFEQAIINLCVNAQDAMPEGGRLVMETHNVELDEDYAVQRAEVEPGRYVMAAISDTGHGMDDSAKARIFEPFYTTKGPGKGTGLGLAMVYGFVKQSGGHIEVYSEIGDGTTFKVYLPRAEDSTPVAPMPAPSLTIPRGDETILVVEDEEAVRDMTRLVLETAGYTVLEAKDGQEALDIIQGYSDVIHLVVTDLVMPRLSGLQLAKLLAKTHPKLRILVMSGYPDEAAMRHGTLNLNFNFLQKPFTPIRLARKVRDVLDAAK